MILCLIFCLGSLVFFKYANFLSNTAIGLIDLFGGHLSYIDLNIILPVGISFYTFQTLSYVIDIYQGKLEPENNFIYYALYVSFFPQLVAGPIERPENLIHQLKNKENFNYENAQIGLKYMLCGFVKKIVIADMLGVFVNRIFNAPSETNGLLVLIGSMLFALQIYGDFSGYSDIAIGCAKLFNINLSENFNHPYMSTSIADFWRRWHISLSTWLRDYIYFPLGGSRCSKFRWCINILVVFFISGLWHGASWTFVIWGLMHAIFEIIGKFTLSLRNKMWTKINVDVNGNGLKTIRIIFTFLLISFTWISFRANSFEDFLSLYKTLFTSWNFSIDYFNNVYNVLDLSIKNVVFIAICITIFPFLDYIKKEYPNSKMSNYVLRKGIYLCLIYLIIFCWIYQKSSDIPSNFIYFQF